MTRSVEVVFPDGTSMTLDNTAHRPGEQEVTTRLLAALKSGEIVTVAGIPCRVVDAGRQPGSDAFQARVSIELQP